MTHYHDYEHIVETNTGIVEVCKICKKRLLTKKDKDGRIDNTAYAKEHIRDFAQPYGATKKIFEQVYGNNKSKNSG